MVRRAISPRRHQQKYTRAPSPPDFTTRHTLGDSRSVQLILLDGTAPPSGRQPLEARPSSGSTACTSIVGGLVRTYRGQFFIAALSLRLTPSGSMSDGARAPLELDSLTCYPMSAVCRGQFPELISQINGLRPYCRAKSAKTTAFVAQSVRGRSP